MTKDTSRRGFFAWLTTAIAGVAFGRSSKAEASPVSAPTDRRVHPGMVRDECGICGFHLYPYWEWQRAQCKSCETILCQGCAVTTQDGVRALSGGDMLPPDMWDNGPLTCFTTVCPICWPKYQDPKVKYRRVEFPRSLTPSGLRQIGKNWGVPAVGRRDWDVPDDGEE